MFKSNSEEKVNHSIKHIMSQSLELEMDDMEYFNNKLSFLKSVTSLIVLFQFFLGIANHGNFNAPSRGIFFFKDWNAYQYYISLL
jgi:hypothetical protein